MRITLARLFLLLVFCAPLSAIAAPQDNSPYKVGALLHITGDYAVQGVAFREGVELAAAEINAAGGINGHPIQAIFEDTQYLPLLSNNGAKKLSQVDQVSAVLVSTVSEAKAAGATLQRAEVPTIVLWDSSPEIEALGDYFFGIGPWSPSSGERTAKFAHDYLKAKNAVIINTNSEWSLYVGNYFASTFKNEGGTVLETLSFNPDERDYRSTLARVRSEKPDIIYAPMDGNIVSFFQQAHQMQVGIPLLTSDIITDDYLSSEPKSFEGVYQSLSAPPDFPATKRMAESYAKYFHRPITQTQFVAWGYDGLELVAQAFREVGPDRVKVKDALHHIHDLDGASGTITMDAHGSAPRPVHMYQVEKGTLKLVEE